MLVYDNKDKVWKLVGVLTGSAGTLPYGIRSYILFVQNYFTEEVMAANWDADILDVQANGTLYWNKEPVVQGDSSWAWHGVKALTPAAATNEELDSSKDLRFNGEGGTLVLKQSVNPGADKLQFSNNYHVVSASGQQYSWVGGGVAAFVAGFFPS